MGDEMSNHGTAIRTSFNLDDLKRVIEAYQGDPIREYMLGKGFDPDDGCYLILPESMRVEFIYQPNFIRFSKIVDAPILLRDPMHKLYRAYRLGMNRCSIGPEDDDLWQDDDLPEELPVSDDDSWEDTPVEDSDGR